MVILVKRGWYIQHGSEQNRTMIGFSENNSLLRRVSVLFTEISELVSFVEEILVDGRMNLRKMRR